MPVSAAQIQAIALKPVPRREPEPLQLKRDTDPFGVWEVDMLLDLLVDMPDENIGANTMKHYGGTSYTNVSGSPNANMTSSQLLAQLPCQHRLLSPHVHVLKLA